MYSSQFGGRAGRSKGKAPKSKKKKCPVCGKKGHTVDKCPTANADASVASAKLRISKGGAGSGRGNKVTRRVKNKKKKSDSPSTIPLPSGFFSGSDSSEAGIAGHLEASQSSPFLYFDTACDVGGVLDTITKLKSDKKLKSKENPSAIYKNALGASAANYGGCICRQYLKLNRPWNSTSSRLQTIKESDPDRIWWCVGLGPGYLADDSSNSEDDSDCEDEGHVVGDLEVSSSNTGVQALVDAAKSDPHIIGFFTTLDYSILDHKGQNREAQLRRFHATCKAAQLLEFPVQISIAPTPDQDTDHNEYSDAIEHASSPEKRRQELYTQVCRDLAKALVSLSSRDPLRVHLTSWSGKCEQMIKLLGAFPDTLFVGMNASVGFSKAKSAHECAFDVPLNRLLLETGAPSFLPPEVAAFAGKGAFCHSGCIPFVAAAIALQKKSVSAVDVARASTENAALIYGKLIAQRAAEAGKEAALRADAAIKARDEDASENEKVHIPVAIADQASKTLNNYGNDEEGSKKKKKKKKKKKAKRGNVNDSSRSQPSENPGSSPMGEEEADAVDIDLDFFN